MPLIGIDQWLRDWFPWLVPVLEWINAVYDWIDLLLKDAMLWFINMIGSGIREIGIQINKARHWMNQAIADFINAPGGGIAALFVAILAGYAIVGISVLLIESGAWAAIVKFLDDVEKFTLGFFDVTFLKLLTTLNKILQFVWTDYREAWKGIWEGIAAIAADLGYATNFIQNIVGVYRAMAYGICSIAGFGPELIETQFTNEVLAFLDTIDAKWEEYARSPEQLMVDFDAWMYSRMFDTYTGQWTALRDGLVSINTTLNTAVESIDAIDDALWKLRSDFDIELQAAVDQWLSWVHDDWEYWLENSWNKYIDTVQGILEIIDESIKQNADRIDELEVKWGEPLLSWYELGNRDAVKLSSDLLTLGNMINREANRETADIATGVALLSDKSSEIPSKPIPDGIGEINGDLSWLDINWMDESDIDQTADWFVGE